MKNLKVAMVQYNADQPDIAHNTEIALKYIKEAKKKGADIVLFPEAFLSSYHCPAICEKLLPDFPPIEEIKDHSEFIKWYSDAITKDEPHMGQIRRLAKELKIGVVITAFSKGSEYPKNTAWIINSDGEIILEYSKVHTCDFWWERYLESGDHFSVCEFDGVKLGVMICYDREYPESARELMLQGAEIILVPNDCGTMKPRLRELSVRAMENMVGIAMANPPGDDGGRSCAYTPIVWDEQGRALDNEMIVADEYFEGIVYADFDIEAIRAFREKEDMGKYRKPEAYLHL